MPRLDPPDDPRRLDAIGDNSGIDPPSRPLSEIDNASEVWDSGPSLGKDGAGVGFDFGEADGSPSGTFKPKVQSSDP